MKFENISVVVDQNLIDWGVKHSEWEPEKVAKSIARLLLWNGPRFHHWDWAIHWDGRRFKVVNDFMHPRHRDEVGDDHYFCNQDGPSEAEVRYDFSHPVFK